MNEILDRYLELNEHAASYTWKRLGRPLDMDQTMEEIWSILLKIIFKIQILKS